MSTTTHASSQRLFAIDFIRLIAICAVLLIHTSARTLESTNLSLQLAPITFFLNQISRFAVPLFFLVSGYVLQISSNPNASLLNYYIRRTKRIAIPYFFWSFFYLIFVYPGQNQTFSQILLLGWASYQLYFIPSLYVLYVLFPLLNRFTKHLSQGKLVTLGIIWLAIQTQVYFSERDVLTHPLVVAGLNLYIFLIGITAAQHPKTLHHYLSKWGRVLPIITLILGVFVYKEGQYWYQQTNNYLYFYSQLRPSITLYTLAVFGTLFYYTRHRLNHRFTHHLANLSFFVYFIHVAVMEFYWKVGLQNLSKQSITLPFDLLFFFLVTITSFAIGYLVHRLPKLKLITG